MSSKQSSTSSPRWPESSSPDANARQPVTALALILCLLLLSLLALWKGETEIALTALGVILSLCSKATSDETPHSI